MDWISFTGITDMMIAALKGDAPLASFCASNRWKTLTVRKGVRRREDIAQTELPLIMLTTPAQSSSYGAGRLLYREYVIRLYGVFQQDNRDAAPDGVIKFEELIEQALLNEATLNAQAIEIAVGDSANDEGFSHPVYTFAKEFRVMVERDI